MWARKRLLMVEDNPLDVRMVERSLKSYQIGTDFSVARDGSEAIDQLSGAKTPLPHLVLLDIRLPKKSGLEVLKEIREDSRLKDVPVVMLTSSDEPSDIANSYRLGANAFVRKESDFDLYQESVKHIFDFWLKLNQTTT